MIVTRKKAKSILKEHLVLTIDPARVLWSGGSQDPLKEYIRTRYAGAPLILQRSAIKCVRTIHPFVVPGRWFPAATPLEALDKYRKVADVVEKYPRYQTSAWYHELLKTLADEGAAFHKRIVMRSRREIDDFFVRYVLPLIESMRDEGYRGDKAPDPLYVLIGSHGELYKAGQGNHRFYVARLVGVRRLPVRVTAASAPPGNAANRDQRERVCLDADASSGYNGATRTSGRNEYLMSMIRTTRLQRAWALTLALMLPAAVGLLQPNEVHAGDPRAEDTDRDGFFADELHRPQVTTNLESELYEYLSMWNDRGYIRGRLPYLRPYPPQVMRAALEEVIERAPQTHARRAREFLRAIDREPGLHFLGEHHSSFNDDGDYFNATGAAVQSTGFLLDNLAISGSLGMYMFDETPFRGTVRDEDRTKSERVWVDDVHPTGSRMGYDYMRDDSVFNVAGRELLGALSVQGVSAFGSENVYGQVGLTRNTYGPFYDSGTILSQNASHAGHFSFTYRSDRFTYQHLLLGLAATPDDGFAPDPRGDGRGDGVGPSQGIRPDKYLAFHSLTFHLLDWLDFSLHESITFGQRLDPIYLVPTSVLIYNQIIYGEKDSAFLGFSVDARLPMDFATSASLYVGDAGFGDLARLDFDTRYKFAAQVGGRWTPMRDVVQRVSADYTMVLPYTYTHRRKPVGDGALYETQHDDASNTSDVNYQNYTHRGHSLVDLDPNSDRLRLQTRLRPHRFVRVNLLAAFMRHANATPDDSVYDDEPGENVGTTDGTVNDSGYRDEDSNLYDEWRFLKQDVIERVIQLGFDTEITLPVEVEWLTATRGTPGTLTFDFGYTFEYGWNRRPRGAGVIVGWPSHEDIDDAERLIRNQPTPEKGNHGARHFGRFGFSLAY